MPAPPPRPMQDGGCIPRHRHHQRPEQRRRPRQPGSPIRARCARPRLAPATSPPTANTARKTRLSVTWLHARSSALHAIANPVSSSPPIHTALVLIVQASQSPISVADRAGVTGAAGAAGRVCVVGAGAVGQGGGAVAVRAAAGCSAVALIWAFSASFSGGSGRFPTPVRHVIIVETDTTKSTLPGKHVSGPCVHIHSVYVRIPIISDSAFAGKATGAEAEQGCHL